MELRAKKSCMINAECAGALSWWRIHRLPSHNSGRTRSFQTLQNLHVESCFDSLTLRCEFVVHYSMAVKKNQQHDFDFWFAFLWFFRSRRFFVFLLSALRLQLDVVIVDPQFITCDDPFQEFIAFLRGFPVGATLLPLQLLLRSEQFRTILAQTFFVSKCSVKIVWTDDFPKPSSSAIILTVNWWSLSTRDCTQLMFSLPLEVEGHPDLGLSLGSSRTSRKCWTHLKTVLSFRPYSP